MLVSVFIGTLVGALAGMSRGALGHGLMWLTDLFLSLPQLPLLLLLIYLFRDGLKQVFGPEGGIFILIVARDRRSALDAGGAPRARAVPVDPREGVRRGRACARCESACDRW